MKFPQNSGFSYSGYCIAHRQFYVQGLNCMNLSTYCGRRLYCNYRQSLYRLEKIQNRNIGYQCNAFFFITSSETKGIPSHISTFFSKKNTHSCQGSNFKRSTNERQGFPSLYFQSWIL
jgi:hypothetical protein